MSELPNAKPALSYSLFCAMLVGDTIMQLEERIYEQECNNKKSSKVNFKTPRGFLYSGITFKC